jgi:DNA-binding NtrC family response regulator
MGGKRTILVVDDEPTVRALIADVLQAGGHTCITAANGLDALRIIEADFIRVDLLLSDVMMPGEVNGFHLARRAQEIDPETRILLISGYVDPKMAEAITSQGFRVIAKPFRQHQLLDAVNEELAKQPHAATGGGAEPPGRIVRIEPGKNRDPKL